MKISGSYRNLLWSILSGAYTPLDVHEFVHLCYSLALPVIRKKLITGKLSPYHLGLKESDIVYDCLADLFRRDEQGRFVKLHSFFESEQLNIDTCHEDELFIALRRLIFLKVSNNVIRLYSEADPTLGKVLRNMRLTNQKERLFDELQRFSETYLVPRGMESLTHCPPYPPEQLEQQFIGGVLVHDTLVVMLRKLHQIVAGQRQYQRAIPLVAAALMVKKVYALGWEGREEEQPLAEATLLQEDIRGTAERVSELLKKKMYSTYVARKKYPEVVIAKYVHAVREILVQEFSGQRPMSGSYFDILKTFMPRMTKKEYATKHRTILEYLAKMAKKEMVAELKRVESA